MIVQVRQVGDEFTVVLPQAAAEALGLSDGASVEILPVGESADRFRYISKEEALKAFTDTLPQHEAAYRALAK